MDSERLEPPRNLLPRLRRLEGYHWEESPRSFHSSYDIWHIFGRKHKNTNTNPSRPPSSTAKSHDAIRRSTQGQVVADTAKRSKSFEDIGIPVVARISIHVLREERAFQVCQTLAASTDPKGNHVARPIENFRLPSQEGDDGPIFVGVFEDPGRNYLSRVLNYGRAWYRLNFHGDTAHGFPNEDFEPELMSLRAFLDFAIGATECIEVLHGQDIVHGELRGDAFHMNIESGKVTLINLGPGRVCTFEPGLTSSGWSTLSKEIGANTKLSYMSPEQTGRMPLQPDSRTDIYSLGVLFWTILAQKPAFEGDTPMKVIQAVLGQRLPLISPVRLDIPEVICQIIQKATAKAVWDRYHSVSGLRYDLTEVRKLLGEGNTSQLANWKIATKDVSPNFILPQAMVGRDSDHDVIIRAIDYAYKSQKRDKQTLAHLSRLSDEQLATFEEAFPTREASVEDEIGSSIDGGTPNPPIIPDTPSVEQQTYEANISRSRSNTTSRTDSTAIPGSSTPNSESRRSEKALSIRLESPTVESLNGEAKSSISGSEGVGGTLASRNMRLQTQGRCEVILIAGSAGLGKSLLIKSVQVEARHRGYFASTKFHRNQTDIRPFDSILTLLSTLFQQVFSESDIDPVFHLVLKRRVMPSWPTLHKMLGLPQFLFGSKMPLRQPSHSSKLSRGYNRSLGPEVKRRSSSSTSTSSGGSTLRKNLGSQSSRNFLLAGSSTHSMSLMNILLDILRIFARHKFICFCLDDIHLADEQSLELLAQIVATRIKMVLILTYRPEEMASESIKRILDSPYNEENRVNGDLEISRITLKPLTQDQTTEYVATTLRYTKSEVLPLGRVMHAQTSGNPFYIKEMLNACYRRKFIWFDFRQSGWLFDLRAIIQQFKEEDFKSGLPEGLVMSRLSELPASSKLILVWASMLGSSFSFQLIQQLMNGEFTPNTLLRNEKTLVNGLQIALEAFIIVPTQNDDVFRFADDRYIEAAAKMEGDRDLMHFVLVQTLLKHYFFDDNYRNILASSTCESINTIKSSITRREPYRRLLSEYAHQICETGVRSSAVRIYTACLELLQDDMWNSDAVDVSYEETLQVHTAAAECFLYEGLYEEARLLFSSVFANARTAVDKAPSWILSSRAFAQEGDSDSAFQALKECLAAFSITVDDNPTFPKCDAEFKRLCQEIQSSDTSVLVKKTMAEDDSNLAAVGAVLVEATSAAFWSDTLTFYQMTLIMIDTYLTLGSFPQAGMGFLQLSLIAITRYNMIAFANESGNIGLALNDKSKDPYTMGRGGTIYPTFLGHIQQPLHALFSQLDGALEYAIQAGDRISTILNYGLAGNLKFFASENLSELETFCTYACQDIPGWESDTPGGTLILTIRQVCRALQGKTHTNDPVLGVLSDEQHNSRAYKSWLLINVKNSDRPLMLYESLEIAPLFLYGHFSSAVMLGNSCLKKINSIWSARNGRFLMFIHALSLSGAVWVRVQEQLEPSYRKVSPFLSSDVDGRSLEPGLQDEMDGLSMLLKYFKKRIEQWQEITDVNYASWSKILGAQICEMENDHVSALRLYDEAIDHATQHKYLFEEALANQLLGGHLLRVGSKRLARMALQESIHLYRRLGASGVASHIEENYYQVLEILKTSSSTAEVGVQTDPYGDLTNIAGFGQDDPQHLGLIEKKDQVDDRIGLWQKGSALAEPGGLAIHMLDLTSILESSQVISSVLQVDQLLKTMCEIILQNCKGVASLVAITTADSTGRWCVAASGDPEQGAKAHSSPLPLRAAFIAENVVNYSSRFRETLFLPDLMQDQRFSNVSETWVARNPGSKSVVAIPISHGQDEKPLLGILYLEGQPNAFTPRNLEVLQLLVNQIGISYANSLTLKEVERVSAINQSMVDVQKKALQDAIVAKNNADIAQAEAVQSAKLAEEAAKIAEEAANAKTTFLANISHELRTPLNGVIGNSELLLLDNQLKESQAEMADSIRVSANLLLSLINDILDFSKIEAHQMQLHLTAFYLEDMVRELIRAIPASRPKHNSRDVSILQELQLPQSLVFGDPVRLHQILGNLIGNSLKFTEKGNITIIAKTDWETETDVQITFCIKDTGIGISTGQLPKLFKPFSQADTSTSRKYGGSGLGLSICKSLVESMGGTINLQSVENIGTTISFSLALPKATAEGSGNISHSPSRPASIVSRSLSYTKEDVQTGYISLTNVPHSELRICIAEDNLINQKIAAQFLQKLKFTCIDAYNNGLEAVEGIRAKAKEGKPYHIILMDVQMPVLDGYEATKLLRKDEADAVRGMLVIALTASAVQGDREKCIAAGMNDYLAKPVRLAVLRDRLKEYIRLE